MGTSGSTPDVSREDVRSVFSEFDGPGTPLATAELADRLGCTERAARRALDELVDIGELWTREIADGSRVWWQSSGGDASGDRHPQREEFGAFVNAVEDYAIFMLDPDGVVASWNEGAERIKGYREDDIVGEHFSTFYTEEDVAEGVPEHNLERAATEGRVEDEGWRVRADGSRFWADVVITAIRADDGTLRGFTKVTRDTTEQREYEQQLRRERDLTEQIVETAPLGIAVLAADGEFVRANRRLLDSLGVDEADIGEYRVGSWTLYDVDGDPIPEDERPWSRCLDAGEPVTGFECQVELRDGDRHWLSIDAAPLADERDDEDRVVVAVDDVTEQKEREQRLRREYEQTEKLLRTVPVGIAVQNADRETVLANERAQEDLGISEQEFVQDPVDSGEWEIYDANGGPLPPEETPSARARETGEPVFDEEVVMEAPDGERRQFRVNAAPITGPDGEVERIVTAGEDITELKRRERKLERRKSELETELGEILDRVSDAFYALDDEWRFTHLNERAAELMRRSRDELIGREIWTVFPEATTERYRDRFRTAMETQEPVSFEIDAEGLDAWLEFNVYPSESGLSVYFRDVTERKQRERELQRTERRFEAIFEDPNILVGLLEPDGTVLDINETAMEYVDADLAAVTGEPFWETPWWGRGDGVQEDVREWVERAAAGEYVDFEADLTRPDGERYTLNGVFRPVTDDDGDVVSIIVSDRDVTERKRHERRLAESERRYRTLAESFPNGIVTLFDEDLEYTLAAGRGFDRTPLEPGDLEGRRATDVWDADTAATLEPIFRDALDGEERSVELSYAGREWILHAVPITDEDGEVFAGVTMAQDITERKERERELAKYETIVETVDDGIYVKDDEGRFTMVNDAYAELTGYDREELVGAHASLVVDEDAIQESREFEEGDRVGDDTTMEALIQRKDGETVPSEGTFATLSTGDGSEKRVGVVRDITERKEQQRRIEESERRYRTLVEHFPNGAVALVDEDLRYQTVGGRPMDVADATAEEIQGRPVEEAVPENLAAELVPRYEAALEGETGAFEIELPEGIYQFQVVPVRDDEGEVFGALGMSQDITERRESQRKLAESERRYRTLIEHFPNGAVGLYDEDLEYVVAGGEAFDDLDVPKESVIGSTIRDRYRDELVEEIEPYFRAALEGESNTFEYRARGRDVWAHTLPVRNDEGDIFGGMVMAQDITERREYERRLEASNERLEQFAYAASHDLQEPLRMVSSYLRLVERRYADELDEDGREFIEFAVDGADRMRDMIEGLLQYSRVETRGDPFEPVDLDTVLEDVREDLTMRVRESGAEITAESLPTVAGDSGQLRQVFQNLLDNAIEYSSDDPPEIHVSAERTGDEWTISVRDEGIGIDPADADRVFEVFQSLHAPDEHSGTGIGLALCERIVERHGGDIWVDSEPGEGSTFYFTLPAEGESDE